MSVALALDYGVLDNKQISFECAFKDFQDLKGFLLNQILFAGRLTHARGSQNCDDHEIATSSSLK